MHVDMDHIRINERAWELILGRINELLESGESQSSVARLIGCDRATVNRWVLNRRGGERTTFKDMVRILDKLRIPLPNVFKEAPGGLPAPAPDSSATPLDRAIARTLRDVFSIMGKPQDSVEGFAPDDVREFLSGRSPLRASDLYLLCKAVGIDPSAVLSRAASLAEEE